MGEVISYTKEALDLFIADAEIVGTDLVLSRKDGSTITIPLGAGGDVTQEDLDAAIAALVDSSPAALNTLNELAAALGDDANFAATVTTALATKATEEYVDDAIAAIDVSDQIPGALLDSTIYNPGGTASTAFTTSPGPLDATNLKVSFVAPASGEVLHRYSSEAYVNGSAGWGGFCVLDETNALVGGSKQQVLYNGGGSTQGGRPVLSFIETGLTPGVTYERRFGQWRSSASGYVEWGGDSGPAIMEVFAIGPAVQEEDLEAIIEALSLIASNNQTDSYTLALSDLGKTVELNKATAVNLTIPANADVAFPVGTTIELWQQGVGQVTVVPAAGVTLRSPSGATKLYGQYSSGALRKRATNEWVLSGDLV